jgi:hypothetical protein
MKTIVSILILVSVSPLAFSQERSLSKSMDDNGGQLSISVHGEVYGKRIDYIRTCCVEGLSKSERNALTDRVLNSLGVGKMESPASPLPPIAPDAPLHAKESESQDDGSRLFLSERVKRDPVTIHGPSYTKEVRYDEESGLLRIRYTFVRNRDEYVYEKTANAADKSESERQEIVHDFEKEIELPATM